MNINNIKKLADEALEIEGILKDRIGGQVLIGKITISSETGSHIGELRKAINNQFLNHFYKILQERKAQIEEEIKKNSCE